MIKNGVLLAVGLVRVAWWKVDEHLAAVDALPPKVVIRELVHEVPAQLLSEETSDPHVLLQQFIT